MSDLALDFNRMVSDSSMEDTNKQYGFDFSSGRPLDTHSSEQKPKIEWEQAKTHQARDDMNRSVGPKNKLDTSKLMDNVQ